MNTIKLLGSSGSVSPTPTIDWRACGLVNGFSTFFTGIRDAAGLFEIWAGAPPLRVLSDLRVAGPELARAPASGGALTIDTTNIADDAAGAGANFVLVSYIQAGSFFERFGIAPASGVAAGIPVLKAEQINGVPTVSDPPTAITDAIRVTGARVLIAGVSNPPRANNVGAIPVSIGANVQAAIAPGKGRALGAFAFIPRGFEGKLTGVGFAAADSTGIDINLFGQVWSYDRKHNLVQALTPWDSFFDIVIPQTAIVVELESPKKLPPMTELSIEANNAGGAQAVSASMSITFIEDTSDPDPDPLLQPPRMNGGGT